MVRTTVCTTQPTTHTSHKHWHYTQPTTTHTTLGIAPNQQPPLANIPKPTVHKSLGITPNQQVTAPLALYPTNNLLWATDPNQQSTQAMALHPTNSPHNPWQPTQQTYPTEQQQSNQPGMWATISSVALSAKPAEQKATAEELANSAVRRALMEEESGMGRPRSGVAAMSEMQEDRQYNIAPQSKVCVWGGREDPTKTCMWQFRGICVDCMDACQALPGSVPNPAPPPPPPTKCQDTFQEVFQAAPKPSPPPHNYPTNIVIARGTLTLGGDTSVSLAMGGVDIWVALSVFISLMHHLYSVSTPGQVLK